MSKHHREPRKPYADWTVSLFADEGAGNIPPLLVTSAVFERDAHGGYTFTDSKGAVTADFPPGTVQHVMRKNTPPDPVVVMVPYILAAETMRGINDALEAAGANARIGIDAPIIDMGYDDDPRKRGTAASVRAGSDA